MAISVHNPHVHGEKGYQVINLEAIGISYVSRSYVKIPTLGVSIQ